MNRFCREVLLESLALCLLALLGWLLVVTPPVGGRLTRKCCPASKCDCDPAGCQCGKSRGLCCDGCSCAISEGGKP